MSVTKGILVENRISMVGKPIPLAENFEPLTGKAVYGVDINLPNTRYVGIYRSHYAHAKILKVDISKALEVPGVLMGLTAADLLNLGYVRPMVGAPAQGASLPPGAKIRVYPHHCLAFDKVRYVGEAVAAIVATDPYVAEDALEHIQADYEPLPPVTSPKQGLAQDSPLLYDEWGDNVAAMYKVSGGNVDEAFRQADSIIKERIEVGRFTAAPLETRTVVANYVQAENTLTLWSSTQQPHNVANLLAKTLAIPNLKVRVIESRIGGGFGQKYGFYPEEVLVPLLSILTGYPTKWVETRSENFVASYHGRDEVHFIEAAVRKDGKILGLRDKVTLDVGAAYHPYVAYYTGMNSTQYVTGAYDIQNYEGESTSVVTNKTPTGPYRGFGKLEPCFVMERLVDIISRQLTIDPTELRLRNFIPPEAFPYVIVTGSRYDSGNYPLALKKAMQIVDYSDWKAKQKEFRALGKYIGIGSALVVEATSTTRATGQLQGYYSVRLRMDPDGRVYVFTSGSEEGQGHATSIAQIIADELQVPFNDIQVVEGDTLVCPLGSGSYSSRFAIVGTAAVTFAVRQLRSKILRIAAETLKCQDDQLELAQGVIYDKNDSQRKVSIRQAAETAYFNIYRLPQDLDPGLEIVYQYKNPNVQPFYDERGRSACFSSFPYDAAIAVVEVDVANGEVKILKFVSVHDCGNLLNPLVASRQHIGALSHGIGNALYEEFVYNADGQPLATTFKDYLIPSIVEMPDLTLDHIITPTPFTPGGFKGVSETGTISAPPALANAIEDALAPLNIAIRKIPLTPIYLRSLIRESLNKPLRRER